MAAHDHLFLAPDHARSERRTWFVIGLCGVFMVVEIAGGLLFGSIALIADGLHMSTHAGALLLAALAYGLARRHARDTRFSFGTGKLGDLAGFTSAVVLAMIALLIAFEAAMRFLHPVPIAFGEAIPIAGVGLCVNIASAWILSGGHHHHGHDHAHDHDRAHHHDHDHDHDRDHDHADDRHDGHDVAMGRVAHRDNNMRAAVVHVVADAAVSVLVIVGLVSARLFGWLWMDPLAGAVGACVIASWSWGLVRDTGAILLDMNPDSAMTKRLREAVEEDGDELADLHLWRLGPGHLGAIVSVKTDQGRNSDHYHAKLARFGGLSHVTVEVTPT
jgi:cation diffusion facilitator family transporter